MFSTYYPVQCSIKIPGNRSNCHCKTLGIYILYQGSFSASKVLHLPCCSSSSAGFWQAAEVDCWAYHQLIATDTQWLQASLSIKYGSLGVKRVSSLVLPAFLASLHLAYCDVPEDRYWKEYLVNCGLQLSVTF